MDEVVDWAKRRRSITEQRLAGFMRLKEEEFGSCSYCVLSPWLGMNAKEYLGFEEVSLEIEGQVWVYDWALEEDVVAIAVAPMGCAHPKSFHPMYITDPDLPTYEIGRYVELRHQGFSVVGATERIKKAALPWVASEDALATARELQRLRVKHGLPPAIPEKWLNEAEWLAMHSADLSPEGVAVSVCCANGLGS